MATAPQPSRYKVRDTSVRMLRGGAGVPLVFLHGASGLTDWLPFYDTLAKHHDVIVPEHPGFGLSDNPLWIRNVADLAMYYLDFLDTLDGPVHLVGQSLGGWAAAELAVRNSSKLASLSLLAPAGVRVKGVPSGDNFIWGPEEGVRNLYHDPAIAERILAQTPTEERAEIALVNRYAVTKFGWDPRWYSPALQRWLHRISVPTAIVWGENDKLFPKDYAGAWHAGIPGSSVTIIPECGHVIAVEKPAPAAEAVLRVASAGSR